MLEALEARDVPSVNVVETEPNNTPATANPIDRLPATQVIVSGSVGGLGDRDWFRFELRKGDVFGAALNGKNGLNASLRLVDSAGTLVVANDDAAGVGQNALPSESPLPYTRSASDAEVYTVISAAGTYFLEASASGDASTGKYELDTRVARPGLEARPVGTRQALFLDFDGASVNFSRYWGATTSGTRQLSGLSSFLPGWGLTAADENAVIDAILSRVTDSLATYIQANGLNDNFGVQILNSRDNPDRFGSDPLVSRVVVGGTPAEAGFSGDFVGFSSDTDVGNFKTNDEAVATLDFIQDGMDVYHPRPDQVVDFVAVGAATLALHEAGHIFGCFHTDQSSTDFLAGVPSLMDPGIGPSLIRSLGPDAVFGTADDFDLRYTADEYLTTEPYRGRDDTLNTIAFGLSVGKGAPARLSGVATGLTGEAGSIAMPVGGPSGSAAVAPAPGQAGRLLWALPGVRPVAVGGTVDSGVYPPPPPRPVLATRNPDDPATSAAVRPMPAVAPDTASGDEVRAGGGNDWFWSDDPLDLLVITPQGEELSRTGRRTIGRWGTARSV
jgi:hypothetical protein